MITGETDAEAGQQLSVELRGPNGFSANYTVELTGNGQWSITVSKEDLADWPEGTLTISASVSDKAGNTASTSQNVTVDTTPPQIAITTPIADDDIINAIEAGQSLTISGTTDAEAGQSVTLSFNGKIYQTGPIAGDGTWSYTIPVGGLEGLQQGANEITAFVYDAAGNRTEAIPHTVTVDTEAPTVEISFSSPVLNIVCKTTDITIAFSDVPLGSDGKELTADQVKALLSLSPSDIVSLGDLTSSDGGKTWTGTLTADEGKESTQVNVSISNAYYDKAGNQGGTDETSIAIDTLAPTITLNDIGDGNLSRSEAAQVVLSGTVKGVKEGAQVTLTIKDTNGNTLMQYATVDGEGNYSTTVDLTAGLADGSLTVNAVVSDAAGNTSKEATQEVNLKLTAPVLTIDSVAGGDNVISWSEKMSDGFTLKGTVQGAQKGQEITVIFTGAEGNITFTTEVGDGDTWSITLTKEQAQQLKDGSVQATVSDKAGNSVTTSQNYVVEAPTPELKITGYYDSVDYVQSAPITAQGELNDSVTLSGSVTNRYGGSLMFQEVSADILKGTYGSFTFDKDTGAWSYTFNAGQKDKLDDSKAPLNELLTVTDTNGQTHQIQITIHDMYPAGKATVSGTVVALKEPVLIEDSQKEGKLAGATEGSQLVADSITVNGEPVTLGKTLEVANIGALTFYEDGRYIFEPYHNGATLEIKYKFEGDDNEHSMTVVATDPVPYSNDLLGRITGSIDTASVPENGKITLRLYVNKSSTDDAREVQYGTVSYPNGHEIIVDVDSEGNWAISPEQLREVLQNIWWADHLRGDDEIYLQVKLVDPVTGKASEVSSKYAFVADSYPPIATNVEYHAPVDDTPAYVTALVSGSLSKDGKTHANTGDKVEISYNGTVIAEGTVGDLADGYAQYLQIRVALTEALPSGYDPDLLKVHVTDKAGNIGTSDAKVIEQSVGELPTPVIEAYMDDKAGGIEGAITSGGLTNDNAGSIRGKITLSTDGDQVDEIRVLVRGLGPITVKPSPDGIWEVTKDQLAGLTTTRTLQDGLVDVVAHAYNKASNKWGLASEKFTFTVDTVSPTVEITIENEQPLTQGNASQVTFKFSEELAEDLTLDTIKVSGGKLSELSKGADANSWTATFTPTPEYQGQISITLEQGSYRDKAGNSGVAANSTVLDVDTRVPTVAVNIEANLLVLDKDTQAGQTTQVTLKFNKVPHDANGNELTGAELRQFLLNNITGTVKPGLTDFSSTDGGLTWIATLTPPVDFEGDFTLTIPEKSYFDIVGISGESGSDEVKVDTIPPVLAPDSDSVTESTSQQPDNKQVATGNVLANDDSSDGVKTVVEFKITVDGEQYSANAGDKITTKYGDITINADGTYTYTLDSKREATYKLNEDDHPVESITYVVKDKNGNTAESTLNITVNGANDVPSLGLSEEAVTPIVSGGWFSTLPTAQAPNLLNKNPNNSSSNSMRFNLKEGVDPSTVRAVINLEMVDNSFSIKVNGKDIFNNGTALDTIFQVERNDRIIGKGTNVVALRFANGDWLGDGKPWEVNKHGLPRFQIVLTAEGVRFFATRTVESTSLEEVFVGSVLETGEAFPNGLTNEGIISPQFNAGSNEIIVNNNDGIGQDFIQGYMKVSAGGSFKISDLDDAEISSATITLKGTKQGDSLVAVLPNSMQSIETVDGNGNKVLTLTSKDGSASLKDFEDALNSVIFMGGGEQGDRTVEIKVMDAHGATSTVIEGTYHYQGPTTKTVKAGGDSRINKWNDAGFKVMGFANGDFESGSVLKTNIIANTVPGTKIGSVANNASGNGLFVSGGDNTDTTSGQERMVIDLGFNAMHAKVSATHFSNYETINWRSYDENGKLVGEGTVNARKYWDARLSDLGGGTTVRDFHIVPNVDGHGQFRYIVLQAGTGNFRIDGLEATSSYDANASASLSEFSFPVDRSSSTDSVEEVAAARFTTFDDVMDFDADTDTDDAQVVHITEDHSVTIADYGHADEIHLDGSVELGLSYADLLSSRDLFSESDKPLKIFGGEDDVLDFGNNGAQETDTQSLGKDSFADSSAEDVDDLNLWVKNGSVEENGVVFDVYEYHAGAGEVDTTNQVLVQQGIEII
ncbi:hypothetical protein AAEX37_00701 [Oligella sp. MSHR50489EDL]|uniref:Ig-like domain-containing protein n=1 Tax=Oligella sp. MSHR50489EDL TaxID=3139409 RepID=UPI003D815209